MGKCATSATRSSRYVFLRRDGEAAGRPRSHPSRGGTRSAQPTTREATWAGVPYAVHGHCGFPSTSNYSSSPLTPMASSSGANPTPPTSLGATISTSGFYVTATSTLPARSTRSRAAPPPDELIGEGVAKLLMPPGRKLSRSVARHEHAVFFSEASVATPIFKLARTLGQGAPVDSFTGSGQQVREHDGQDAIVGRQPHGY